MISKIETTIENPMYNYSVSLVSSSHIVCSQDDCVNIAPIDFPSCWSVLRVIDGSGICELKNRCKVEFGANHFFILPAKQYCSVTATSERLEYYFFTFLADKNNIPYPDFIYCFDILNDEIDLENKLTDTEKEQAFFKSIYNSALFSLLYTIWMKHLRKEYNKYFLFLNRTMDEINKNIQSSVNELSQVNNMSAQNYRICFKKYFSTTPKKYIKKKRIELAKQLLATTLMQIKEIAEQLGYDNQYYFSTDFKNSVGVSPSFYRKSNLEPKSTL